MLHCLLEIMFQIRLYDPNKTTDLDALYEICLATGDNGSDGSHLFSNPKLIGDFYAAPYAVLEPTLCFLLEDAQEVCGYIIGALDTETFNKKMNTSWLPKARQSHPKPANPTFKSELEKSLIELIHTDLEFDNQLSAYPSHLHIDLLPRAQKNGQGKLLMQELWQALKAAGSPGVHLGVSAKNTNAIGFYQAIGFESKIDYEWGKIMTKVL